MRSKPFVVALMREAMELTSYYRVLEIYTGLVYHPARGKLSGKGLRNILLPEGGYDINLLNPPGPPQRKTDGLSRGDML